MKEIQLSRGMVTLVDDEDYEFLNQWKWSVYQRRNIFYAYRNIYIKNKITCVIMHRLITDAPKGKEVDHIDHDGLNNQKSNLRICTHSQNLKNRSSSGKSKYLGVYRQYGKYIMACIAHKRIGSFKTEVAAARAYDEVAKELYGEFANLNFK